MKKRAFLLSKGLLATLLLSSSNVFSDITIDGDISDWTIVYGSVTCYNGVMIVNPTSKHCKSPDHPSGDPYLFQCAALYKNYTYTGPLVAEFDFKLSKIWQGVNNGVTRVRFLYQDWFNYWEVLLGGDAEDNDYCLDKRVSGEKPTYPFGDPTVIGDTNWHTAKIVRDQNGNWELHRDGVKILGIHRNNVEKYMGVSYNETNPFYSFSIFEPNGRMADSGSAGFHLLP